MSWAEGELVREREKRCPGAVPKDRRESRATRIGWPGVALVGVADGLELLCASSGR